MTIITDILIIALAYLMGSIPFGLLVGRWVKGIDVRQHGSGNLGATNVFRVVGKKWGILVLFLDALKGYLAVALPALLLNDLPPPIMIMLAIAAIIGHTFPVWLSFKGGKGVATSLGVFLALAFVPTLMTFGLWILVFMMTRIISIASLSAATAYPAILWFMARTDDIFPWLFPVSFILAAFIFFTHRANIRRLIRKEEKRLI